MRAILVKSPGGVEELEISELPDLSPGPGEVVVRNFAAGINRADLLQRRGLYPPPKGVTDVLGLEFAGEVEIIGERIEGIEVGDRVCGLVPGGGYQEQVLTRPELLVPIPDHFSYEAAAAVPEAFMTASEALFHLAQLRPDEKVLIHAGASGVGTAAIQLAKSVGAQIAVTVSNSEKAEYCRSLGADLTISYLEEDFQEQIQAEWGSHSVDVVLDFIGAKYWEQNLKCLKFGGRWLVLGLLGGNRLEVDLGKILFQRLKILGLAMRGLPLEDKIRITETFKKVQLPLFEDETLKPIIDRVYLFEEVQEAHRRMEANENKGKLILRF